MKDNVVSNNHCNKKLTWFYWATTPVINVIKKPENSKEENEIPYTCRNEGSHPDNLHIFEILFIFKNKDNTQEILYVHVQTVEHQEEVAICKVIIIAGIHKEVEHPQQPSCDDIRDAEGPEVDLKLFLLESKFAPIFLCSISFFMVIWIVFVSFL